jgi:hypothetical protein
MNITFYLHSLCKFVSNPGVIDILEAESSIDKSRRKPNKDLRKYLHKKLFVALDFSALEKGERRNFLICPVIFLPDSILNVDLFFLSRELHGI